MMDQTRGQLPCLRAQDPSSPYHSCLGKELKDSRVTWCWGVSSRWAGPLWGEGAGGWQGWESREQAGPWGTSCRAQKDASISTMVLRW